MSADRPPFPWRARVIARETGAAPSDVEWLTYRAEHVDAATAPEEYRIPLIGGPDVVAAVVHDRAAAKLVLVRQVRPGPLLHARAGETPDWPAEVVVGVLDPGREPSEMIRQEIREETGAIVERLEPAGVVYLNPADSARRAHVFYAGVAPAPPPRHRLGHAGETLVAEYVPLADLDEWLARGRIADTLSICALALCRRFIAP